MTDLVVFAPNAESYLRLLQEEFPTVAVHGATSEGELTGLVEEMEILVAYTIREELLRRASKLQWIQSLITGTDSITKQPSLRKEVIVTSTRGIHGPQMSEMAFLLMLSLSRDFPQMVRNQDAGIWRHWPGNLLYRKKVGIFGVGVIGGEIARKCKAFGMSVYGINRVPRKIDTLDYAFGSEDILKVAAEVDFFIIVAPSTPETYRIVSAEVLSSMKPTAYLINLARGDLVDEEALIGALNSKKIAGAALDVFAKEPLPPDHPFWKMRNVVITPHVGGTSDIYVEQAMGIIRENLRRFLRGERKDLINLVAH